MFVETQTCFYVTVYEKAAPPWVNHLSNFLRCRFRENQDFREITGFLLSSSRRTARENRRERFLYVCHDVCHGNSIGISVNLPFFPTESIRLPLYPFGAHGGAQVSAKLRSRNMQGADPDAPRGDVGKPFLKKGATRRVICYLIEIPNVPPENLGQVFPNPFKKL